MKSFSRIRIEAFSPCHIQGIAIDQKREYIYCSFTTSLIKIDMQGNLIGSVNGIVGHLGCIAYNDNDGRVYGSLEYKNDSVGRGILKAENSNMLFDDSFYVASFDVDKITRPDMDAYKDGIMKAVFLKEVVNDYSSSGHRYGCSGIDGVTFAHTPGENSDNCLYVAYGIYGDNGRRDNDHQIILRFDMEEIYKSEKPLQQENLHKSGPDCANDKYFIYTGNTTYGIQNLEYDRDNNCMFAAVYKGKKWRYPNYSLFAIDLSADAKNIKLKALNEYGHSLNLKDFPFFRKRGKICGSNFPYGTTGMISLGNGRFIFSEDFNDENGYGAELCSYKLDLKKGFVKKEISL